MTTNTAGALNTYRIKATIEGQSWSTRGTVLKAENEDTAREKAKKVLLLSAQHQITIEPVQVFNSSHKIEVNNYPYGSLRATAFFSVESNSKGMRTIFQTINPKTGRINAPKKGNYYQVILPTIEADGKASFCGYLDFNGSEDINRGLYFMHDFFDLFTPEEIKRIAVHCIAMSKVNAKAMVIYSGADWEQLKPLVSHSVETLVKIANTGENLFLEALVDVEKIEATKKPDFNPFTITEKTI